MENINNEKMEQKLLEQAYIQVEKKFFGLWKKVTYTPTNSPVAGRCLEYTPANGEKVQQLIAAAPRNISAMLKEKGCPESCENGNYLLSLCFSQDRKFAALQLSRYSNFAYHPIGEVRFVEGDDAQEILRPFVK